MTDPIKPGFWKSLAGDNGVQTSLASVAASTIVASVRFILFRK